MNCLPRSLVGLRSELKWAGNKEEMLEQIFKNIDDVLWNEAGCATKLFLKHLDDLESANAQEGGIHVSVGDDY